MSIEDIKIINLMYKNSELQDRINKAIEYIENKEDYINDYDAHLLDILKGSDKE